MPIPVPKSKEEKKNFIPRCISTLKEKDPKLSHSQIVAICFDTWRRKNRKNG